MIILGIDPGIAIVGYGVIEYSGNKFKVLNYGAITTKAGTKVKDRLKTIYDSLIDIIREFKPDCIAIEELFHNNNAKTIINVAQGRAMPYLAAANCALEIATSLIESEAE